MFGGLVMRIFPIALVVLLLGLAPAQPQPPLRLYTHARIPPQQVLDRLGLVVVWDARVPVESRRDGLASVQLLTEKSGDQLLVQTSIGQIQLMEAATGDVLWRAVAGRPYEHLEPAAWNADSIMVNRRHVLYVLDRRTGRHRVFGVAQIGNQPLPGYEMAHVPSSTPVANDQLLFVPASDRVVVYKLPKFLPSHVTVASLPERGKDSPTDRFEPSLQPIYGWAVRTVETPVNFPLVLGNNHVSFVSSTGLFISLNSLGPVERYNYKFGGTVSAPMGWYEDIAYVGCDDHVLYALHMISRKLLWRYQAGGPVIRRPEVTERDVFVTALKMGLARVDRDSGERIWLNREAQQFLATNNRYVYALDRNHQLLVLDYLRGTTLARADFGDFQVPVSNPDTDRLLLGNHDGLLLCLRHRDNVEVLRHRPVPEREVPKPRDDKKPQDKEKEKDKNGQQGRLPPHQREQAWRTCQVRPSLIAVLNRPE